jgi:hypothetical protein
MFCISATVLSPQAFSQFRCKLQKKTEEEIETLRKNPKV